MSDLEFINNLMPKNRQIAEDTFFGIDFDATLVNNDPINLEVDHAVVAATVATWLGEEVKPNDTYEFLSAQDVAAINQSVKAAIPATTDEQKAALRATLAQPRLMSIYLDKPNESVGWFHNNREYNDSMAGKPINKLLCYLAAEAGIDNGEQKAFAAFIEDRIVEDIEVDSINRIVPEKINAPFEGWIEGLNDLKAKGVPFAVVTSSEYTRVLPVMKSSGLGEIFGLTDEHYDLLKRSILTRQLYKEAKREGASEDMLLILDRTKREAALALHNAIENDPNVHIYSAKEAVDFGEVKDRKPHADIYGLAFAKERDKRGIDFTNAVMIEDSGSIGCILDKEGQLVGSAGYCGAAKGENLSGANYFTTAIGFIAASHYDFNKQTQKLLKESNNTAVIMQDAGLVCGFVGAHADRVKATADEGLTGVDNRQAMASALAKYTSHLGGNER